MSLTFGFGKYKGKKGNYGLIKIYGKVLDRDSSEEVRSVLLSYLESEFDSGEYNCIDLSALERVHSSVFSAFLSFGRRTNEAGKGYPCLLIPKGGSVEHLLKISSLKKIFKPVNSLDEL